MADRPKRAIRRQVSDVADDPSDSSGGESEDFDPRRADAARRGAKHENAISPPQARSKRSSTASSVIRSHTSPTNDGKQSIRLTMKVAPSKLREVMRANEVDALQDTLGGGQVIDGPRSRRSAAQPTPRSSTGGRASAQRSKYQEYAESEIDDAEEEEVEDDDEGDGEDATMNDFDETGAEPEASTDEGDEDEEMEDAPPTPPVVKKNQMPPKGPKITLKAAPKSDKSPGRPKLIVTPANVGPVKPVEDQEMEDDPGESDEETSDQSGDRNDETNVDQEDGEEEDEEDDDEDDEEEEDEDAEGEDEEGVGEDEGEIEVEGEGEEDEEDDDSDSSDETPASGMQTPDPAKMTQRQRRQPAQELMALDMAPQQRKFFTDAEKAMKKDEHARKRKELTKRKTQEEKTAALNRLLKPQVSKTRGAAPKAETLAAQMQAVADEEFIIEKADAMYTRWISTKEGVQLAVPEDWLGKRVGKYFGPPVPVSDGAMVQEVD